MARPLEVVPEPAPMLLVDEEPVAPIVEPLEPVEPIVDPVDPVEPAVEPDVDGVAPIVLPEEPVVPAAPVDPVAPPVAPGVPVVPIGVFCELVWPAPVAGLAVPVLGCVPWATAVPITATVAKPASRLLSWLDAVMSMTPEKLD